METTQQTEKIRGWLLRVNDIEEYFSMKSYFVSQWESEYVWMNQYEKHYRERQLFAKYDVKFAFVSEDFKKILLAGNDNLEPLGKLFGKVEIFNTTIATCRQMWNYAKAYRNLHTSKDGSSGSYVWHHAALEGDPAIQPMANFLHNCGYEIKVSRGAVGHSIVSINGVTHIAYFGENPYGKEIPIEKMRNELCKDLNITAEKTQEFERQSCGIKILPSFVVSLTKGDRQMREKIAKKLRDSGFDYCFIIAFTPDHSKIYVDFHHKEACCGVTGRYNKKYEITPEQLEELLKKYTDRGEI